MFLLSSALFLQTVDFLIIHHTLTLIIHLFFSAVTALLWTSVDTVISVSVNHRLALEPAHRSSYTTHLLAGCPVTLSSPSPSSAVHLSSSASFTPSLLPQVVLFTVALPSFKSFTLPLPPIFVSFACLLLMRRLQYANSTLILLISVFLSNLKANPPNLCGVDEMHTHSQKHRQHTLTCVFSSLQPHFFLIKTVRIFVGGRSWWFINLMNSSAQLV